MNPLGSLDSSSDTASVIAENQIVLFLFNRSNETTRFIFDMSRCADTDPGRGASGKQWRQHKYRTPVGSPVLAFGRMLFDVEPYGVQIWHLEAV